MGLNHGHIVTIPKSPQNEFKRNKSIRKGRLHPRVEAVRAVITEVCGLSPFQRKMMEMIKTGEAKQEKKAVRLARKKIGSHKRAQKSRDKIANIIAAQRKRK